MTAKPHAPDRDGDESRRPEPEPVGLLARNPAWVVMDDATALLRLHELERLAWLRTIEHLAPDVSRASLQAADTLVEKLHGYPRSWVARLLLTNAELCARLPAAGEEWGDPAPWQVLTRIHSECRRALLQEPHIVRRYAWRHTSELQQTLRAHAVRALVTSALTWPQLSLVLKALRATDFADDYLCGDDNDDATPEALNLAALTRLFDDRPQAAELILIASDRSGTPRARITRYDRQQPGRPKHTTTVTMSELPRTLEGILRQSAHRQGTGPPHAEAS